MQEVGEPIDGSQWRNSRALIEAGYIRPPETDEEKGAIEDEEKGGSYEWEL